MPSHNNDADTERKISEFERRKLQSLQSKKQAFEQNRSKFMAPKFFNVARRPGARGK